MSELSTGRLRGRYGQKSYRVMKRVFDFVLALFGLLVLLPLFLIIAAAIAISDGFPVVFRQSRVGEGGRIFDIFKFRTMRKDAEEILRKHPELLEEYRKNFKIENDPRILKIGKFLRSSSLDELPQLINVLIGNMSLVGPRPIVVPELEKYGDSQHLYVAMQPGCAGLWQCSGRSDLTYEERVELDLLYYKEASIRYDIVILLKTVVSVFKRHGAR